MPLQSFSEEVTHGQFSANSKSPLFSKGHVSYVNEMRKGGGIPYWNVLPFSVPF